MRFLRHIRRTMHIFCTPMTFQRKEGRVSYLESIVKKSKNSPEVKDKIQLSVDSHLLTLSTCVSRQADKRFVVQAILLNEEQL